MQEALEGQTLGHYQLQRRIGRGGMAEVYLAYDEHLHREIAVKIVHRGRTDDLARFRHEAEMLAPLTHEHILPVYDYSQEGSWHYLVMPYISHGTLADRLQTRGPLTMEEAGTLLDQIASALQYAHDRGILHRDIKPSNILLRDDAFAYLADFGIARLLERESGLTQAGSFIGTPEYMAPELFESQASQSSDIYALGIVLYSLLTGRLPFIGPNPLAILCRSSFTSRPRRRPGSIRLSRPRLSRSSSVLWRKIPAGVSRAHVLSRMSIVTPCRLPPCSLRNLPTRPLASTLIQLWQCGLLRSLLLDFDPLPGPLFQRASRVGAARSR